MTDFDGVTLLDGGMGQELVRRSRLGPTPLWSSRVLLDEPDLVEQLHFEFIEAGADILTVSSYAATPTRLARDGAPEMFEPVQRAALTAAESARARSDRPIRLAGCLPPLVASYHADLARPYARAVPEYRRIAAVQAPHVDLFLCETMGSASEAAAATDAGVETGLPVWTALTVRDADGSKLRSGEPVTVGAEAALAAGADAVLINCSTPEAVSVGLGALAAAGLETRLGGYANGFVRADALAAGGTVEVLEARTDLSPAAYAGFALDWARTGARIVGGCCEVGPRHIAEIARQMRG
ncbi:MAG: homocysteine S-methyltransferase family protein [Pseudomonadota bacterium]